MAQKYQSDIPALDNVQNSNTAANDLLDANAPGIAQGQNLDPGILQAAVDEANVLKSSHNIVCGHHVTTREVGQAFDHAQHSIANEHMAGTCDEAMAPAWFTNAVNKALAPIQAAQESIFIRFDNLDIKRQNALIFTVRDGIPFFPLKKQVAGVGPGLPGHNVQIAPTAVVAFGATMNVPPFPATKGTLNNLTERQLSELSAIYNEDFGIIPGDTVEIQRKKFGWFIS